MMTSSRPRDEIAGSFGTRRGHASQLSISDPSHHVTEAIGTLYGDEDDSGSEGGRPLSFVDGSSYQEQIHRPSQPEPHEHHHPHQQTHESPRQRSISDQSPIPPTSHGERGSLRKSQTLSIPSPLQRNNSYENGSKSPVSPTLSLRDVQADATGSQFPLTNIDNPSDIAQELSNLQALRRLSMDVGNNIDPDMPPMTLSAMPVIAPHGDDDENDPSRLLWVPARVHPELAPTEFKSFLENRVQSIRRRSGDPFLSVDGDASLSSSGSSLRRKKSMLSRQVINSGERGALGYVDGAERLERQRSSGSQHNPELSLEELVKDPTKAVQRLAHESQGASRGIDDSDDDMPILPMAPGTGLRRSTRTTYRKGGSLRSGDRGSLSRRHGHRQQDSESTEATASSTIDPPKDHTLPTSVQSEPKAEKSSRLTRPARRLNGLSLDSSAELVGADGPAEDSVDTRAASSHARQDQLPVRTSSAPANAQSKELPMPTGRTERIDNKNSRIFPQRSSSQNAGPPRDSQLEIMAEDAHARPGWRSTNSTIKQSTQSQYAPKSPTSMQIHAINDSLASPSSISGVDASRTDNLTFIPTLTQPEKKPDKKSKKDRDDDSNTSSRSASAWKWFKGVTDERDKKKEEGKRSKTKAAVDRIQDNVRLDVIQTSIDKNPVKGRESVVLDRDSVDSKLVEERKKESHRKSDSKRDKDGSIFSSIFGGSKKKEEKEKVSKKSQHLQVPEDMSYKPLTPDVDFNWTRFPLLEERAIYRMAHIKLANPRRSLLSQVLLSNFMYSYLAIVQAMHPQMNVPTSPQQKRLDEEARRKRKEQEFLAQQQPQDGQNAEHSLEQYNFDYHRAAVQYADSGAEGQVEYVDDAQIYEDEHGNDHQDGYGYEGIESYGHDSKEYSQYRDTGDDHRRQGRDDMW